MTARLTLSIACLSVAMMPGLAASFPISDPLAASPDALRVTLNLPNGIGIEPGSAALNISVTNPKNKRVQFSSDMLTEIGTQNGSHSLAFATPKQTQFSALEKVVADWRRAQAAPAAEIDITFKPCRTTDQAKPGGTISVSLQPSADAPRLVLVPAGTLLSDYLGSASSPLAACPK